MVGKPLCEGAHRVPCAHVQCVPCAQSLHRPPSGSGPQRSPSQPFLQADAQKHLQIISRASPGVPRAGERFRAVSGQAVYSIAQRAITSSAINHKHSFKEHAGKHDRSTRARAHRGRATVTQQQPASTPVSFTLPTGFCVQTFSITIDAVSWVRKWSALPRTRSMWPRPQERAPAHPLFVNTATPGSQGNLSGQNTCRRVLYVT